MKKIFLISLLFLVSFLVFADTSDAHWTVKIEQIYTDINGQVRIVVDDYIDPNPIPSNPGTATKPTSTVLYINAVDEASLSRILSVAMFAWSINANVRIQTIYDYSDSKYYIQYVKIMK
jgi:hypothetical protein